MGKTHIPVDYFVKVPYLLGTRNLLITIDNSSTNSPVRFVNPRGDELIVASSEPDPWKTVVDFSELLRKGGV